MVNADRDRSERPDLERDLTKLLAADKAEESCTDSRCAAQTHPRESDAIRSLVDSAKAQGKAERTIRDLRAEVAEVTSELARWRTMWDRHGKADLLARAESAEAALTRVREYCDRLREFDRGKPGVIGWWPQTVSVGDVLRDLRAALDPASPAPRPVDAPADDEGTGTGAAPSEGHSEAQGGESA